MASTPKDNSSMSSADMIAGQVLSFPAFSDAKKMKRPLKEVFQIILDAYEQEQLTEEQDLVLESLLYLHAMTEEFDLRRALSLWDDADIGQFFAICRQYRQESRSKA